MWSNETNRQMKHSNSIAHLLFEQKEMGIIHDAQSFILGSTWIIATQIYISSFPIVKNENVMDSARWKQEGERRSE